MDRWRQRHFAKQNTLCSELRRGDMWNLQRSQIKLMDQKEAHMTSSRLAISNVCTDRAVGSAAGKKRAILDSLSAMP